MSQPFGDAPEQATVPLTGDLLTFQRFAVEIVEGDDVGRRVESEGERLSIGSAQGNALRLNDRAASRHHCTITATPSGFFLLDLDSTNGVRLGGFRVGAAYVKSGALFKVGRTKIKFESLDDSYVAPVSEEGVFGSVIGGSLEMRRIFATLPRVAAASSTILIEGETGTGKTLLARAIHDASPRADGPFIVVDCAAMTPTLIESQLFGHVRGAYTGASDDRSGAFVTAAGGTVFLDEVGELPLQMQPKLLRVLEERVVTPLGDTNSVPIDVRIVAATNRDLRERVNAGHFRADLFYRLHVVTLRVPALRKRPGDIVALAEHFWKQCAPEGQVLPQSVLEAWKQRRWEGNVRELRSAVERLLLLDETGSATSGATASDLKLPPGVSFRAAKEDAVTRFERAFLGALIQDAGGNITHAARAAKMDRNHLRELLRRHGLIDAG